MDYPQVLRRTFAVVAELCNKADVFAERSLGHHCVRVNNQTLKIRTLWWRWEDLDTGALGEQPSLRDAVVTAISHFIEKLQRCQARLDRCIDRNLLLTQYQAAQKVMSVLEDAEGAHTVVLEYVAMHLDEAAAAARAAGGGSAAARSAVARRGAVCAADAAALCELLQRAAYMIRAICDNGDAFAEIKLGHHYVRINNHSVTTRGLWRHWESLKEPLSCLAPEPHASVVTSTEHMVDKLGTCRVRLDRYINVGLMPLLRTRYQASVKIIKVLADVDKAHAVLLEHAISVLRSHHLLDAADPAIAPASTAAAAAASAGAAAAAAAAGARAGLSPGASSRSLPQPPRSVARGAGQPAGPATTTATGGTQTTPTSQRRALSAVQEIQVAQQQGGVYDGGAASPWREEGATPPPPRPLTARDWRAAAAALGAAGRFSFDSVTPGGASTAGSSSRVRDSAARPMHAASPGRDGNSGGSDVGSYDGNGGGSPAGTARLSRSSFRNPLAKPSAVFRTSDSTSNRDQSGAMAPTSAARTVAGAAAAPEPAGGPTTALYVAGQSEPLLQAADGTVTVGGQRYTVVWGAAPDAGGHNAYLVPVVTTAAALAPVASAFTHPPPPLAPIPDVRLGNMAATTGPYVPHALAPAGPPPLLQQPAPAWSTGRNTPGGRQRYNGAVSLSGLTSARLGQDAARKLLASYSPRSASAAVEYASGGGGASTPLRGRGPWASSPVGAASPNSLTVHTRDMRSMRRGGLSARAAASAALPLAASLQRGGAGSARHTVATRASCGSLIATLPPRASASAAGPAAAATAAHHAATRRSLDGGASSVARGGSFDGSAASAAEAPLRASAASLPPAPLPLPVAPPLPPPLPELPSRRSLWMSLPAPSAGAGRIGSWATPFTAGLMSTSSSATPGGSSVSRHGGPGSRVGVRPPPPSNPGEVQRRSHELHAGYVAPAAFAVSQSLAASRAARGGSLHAFSPAPPSVRHSYSHPTWHVVPLGGGAEREAAAVIAVETPTAGRGAAAGDGGSEGPDVASMRQHAAELSARAQGGDSTAVEELGMLVRGGAPGVPASPVVARGLLVFAAQHGSSQACHVLSQMWLAGEGGDADADTAGAWARAAVDIAEGRTPELPAAEEQVERVLGLDGEGGEQQEAQVEGGLGLDGDGDDGEYSEDDATRDGASSSSEAWADIESS
ncbi:hypothetical protein FOA52_002547 [Chlamydomonas sp. UWO 241]|nr:hypothetical protein FOA52_002547 [Chlamydomonas sp. UWO 241]